MAINVHGNEVTCWYATTAEGCGEATPAAASRMGSWAAAIIRATKNSESIVFAW